MKIKKALKILAVTKNYKANDINKCRRIIEIYETLKSISEKDDLIDDKSLKAYLLEGLELKGLPTDEISAFIDNSLSSLAILTQKTIQLFCFPYAGGGSDFYKKWKKKYNSTFFFDIELVEYSGRGEKTGTPLIKDFTEIVTQLADEIGRRINRPFAFFGHSLGAILAFEIAKKIKIDKKISPIGLFLSGCPAPDYLPDQISLQNLSDDEFIAKIIQLGGIPQEIINEPEPLNFFLPYLKNDFSLIDTYTSLNTDLFTVPLVVFTGDKDPKVSVKQVMGWESYTNSFFECHVMPGDHFFVKDESAILEKINLHLGEII